MCEKCNEKYNGWTNRETWLVNLWGFLEMFVDDVEVTAEQLKETFEELCITDDSASLVNDLLSGATSRINWYELASNHNDNVDWGDC